MTFEELREKALSLPLKPGVYLMMDKTGVVIYVGKAKALKNRVSQYFHDQSNHTEKTRTMVSQIDHFDTIVVSTEFEALVLENSLIKRHQPRYNILLKDGKGYPYIRLSIQEPYPDVSLVGKRTGDGAMYFGPFGGRYESQAMLDALRIALKLPACGKRFPKDQGKDRPCLNYHMGQCDGYCRKEVPQHQHREAIEQAVRLLEGKFYEVEQELKEEMMQVAEHLEFEKAAVLRDRLKAISLLGKRQKVIAAYLADTDVLGFFGDEIRCTVSVLHFREGELTGREVSFFPDHGESPEEVLSTFLVQYYGDRGSLPRQILLPEELEDEASITRLLSQQAGRKVELVTPRRGAKRDIIRMAQENAREECQRVTTKEERQGKLLSLLGEMLSLPGPPRRIEAYDISNTGASDIVAAMTVFVDGKPKKGAYRYFKLRGLERPDDYASMEQTLTRRFRRQAEGDTVFGDWPDLLLIDGGETHAAVAARVLKAVSLSIPVYGMVKDDRHRTRALVTPEGQEIGIQGNPALFALIGQIQEETHRTAVNFHHKQHTKSSTASTLERIPGIGEVRRKALIRQFGSVKKIRGATAEELSAVLPRPVSQTVYEHFHRGEQEEPLCE